MDMAKLEKFVDPVYNLPLDGFSVTATDAVILAQETAKRYELPTDTAFVKIDCEKDFYALFGGVTVVAARPDDISPEDDILDGTAPVLNPSGILKVPSDATHIGFIAPAACVVYVQRWKA